MRGLGNVIPPKPRYSVIWDVSKVLVYLSTLFPLESLSLKMLTLKLTALIALSSAPRAQALASLNLDCMQVMDSKVVFHFNNLLKTSKQGKSFTLELKHFANEKLCVMHTLLKYVEKTSNIRKSRQLLVSYCSYMSVTTSTIARWLKEILNLSGINTQTFKAHSYRSAATSAAFSKGCSLKDILKMADWSSSKNFYKFYYRESAKEVYFSDAVLNSV